MGLIFPILIIYKVSQTIHGITELYYNLNIKFILLSQFLYHCILFYSLQMSELITSQM